MTWDPHTTTTIRRSIYLKQNVMESLHMRQEAEGGLSIRICQIIVNFSQLFDDLIPDCFSDDEWLDIFLAIPQLSEENYLVGEIGEILTKSDDTIKQDYVAELTAKLNLLNRPQWVMMKEANFRYWTARKVGLGPAASLELTFSNKKTT